MFKLNAIHSGYFISFKKVRAGMFKLNAIHIGRIGNIVGHSRGDSDVIVES